MSKKEIGYKYLNEEKPNVEGLKMKVDKPLYAEIKVGKFLGKESSAKSFSKSDSSHKSLILSPPLSLNKNTSGNTLGTDNLNGGQKIPIRYSELQILND